MRYSFRVTLPTIPKAISLLTTALLSATLFAACNPDPETAVERANSSSASSDLKLLYWQSPTTLNPHLSNGLKDLEAASIVYEPLAAYDEEEKLIPILAAEIPTQANGGISADNTSVIWKLRDGIVWSDGKPFTAKDVVFTYDFITNPATGATSTEFYGEIASVEAVDDLTVEVTFKQPTGAALSSFVGGSGMILPAHIFANYIGAAARSAPGNTSPIGTNAFQVKEFRPGDTIIYEPNPNFRGDSSPFTTVELKGGGDAVSAARARFANPRSRLWLEHTGRTRRHRTTRSR